MAYTKTRARLAALGITVALGILADTLPASAQISSDDDDVLNGQQYLVRADDLVVADPAYVSGSTDKTNVDYFPLDTEDMMITTSSSVSATKLVSLSCTASSSSNTPFPQQTQTMRMFNLPDDVVVTFAPTSGVTGSGCENQQAGAMTFYIDDRLAGTSYKSVVSGDIRNRWLHTAVGDFNGDGFDDLFITSDERMYVATAVDTDSPDMGIRIASTVNIGSAATAMNDPVVGDFNADGNLDVAWMGTGFSSGNTPSVKFATICTGAIENTVCESYDTFDIVYQPDAEIAPQPSDGTLVTVGGKCTQNDNNQIGSETRAPAMAVAAGQFDDTPGDELVVVSLYEHDSNHNCHVLAEAYSFTQFGGESDDPGELLVPKFESSQDNIATHDHISNPASIYAEAGSLDWSSTKQSVPIVISGGTNHSVLVAYFPDNDLTMALQRHEFSTNHGKSFAGLAIGRFSSAPSADESTSCTVDTDCPDTCKSNVCEISGFSCQSDGDCQGTCTSDGVCSYVKPNNYNLQFSAFLMARSSDHTSDVYIYTADPANEFQPKQIQQFTVNDFVQTATDRAVRCGSLLRAGDLQGRSQRLGNPTVTRISDTYQPDVVLLAPPTHADWLPFSSIPSYQSLFCEGPCPGSFSPSNICSCDPNTNPPISDTSCADGSPLYCLVNFSVLPASYTSQYAFDKSSSKQSSSTDTTAWSLGLSTDIKEKTKSMTPVGLQVTQEVSFATQNTYNQSVAKTHNKYSQNDFNGATTTGFDDHVWYSARNYNVYLYPVIGQTICVNSCQDGFCSITTSVACTDDSDCDNESIDPTNCSDSSMQQLYVQYSGATSVSVDDYGASMLEWYQPVHEPGQILSYPWNCDQLAARYGVNICDPNGDDYTLLAETASFRTDTDADTTMSMNWTVGKGSSVMTVKGGQWSQALSETVSVGTSSLESEVEGFKVTESATINASESYTTAKTNSTSLGSSTGVTIQTPGTFLDDTAYAVEGFIFGDAPAPGSLQKLTPTDAENSVLANGVIRTAFTADPTSGNLWWMSGNPYDSIDVALNRPNHLYTQSDQGHSNPSVTQCLPVSEGSAVTDDCVLYDAADPRPASVWTNGFYSLRGFFITPADAVGQGPQLQEANEGDQLALQVRVYNYSLTDMPASSEIRVDFYAQEWDKDCPAPAGYYQHDSCMQDGTLVDCTGSAACAPTATCCIENTPVGSVQIGQDVLDPLPGFNSPNANGASNWQFATTTFDTGDPSVCGNDGCGGKYFVFWVVVWPQQVSNGTAVLLAELPDHSLTGIPGQLAWIGDLCPIDNDCASGTCRATGGTCSTNDDCPTAADNTCGSDGTCAVSGVSCSSDSDCGTCLCKDGCVQEFSNNVGLYKQDIHILPAGTQAVAPEGEVSVDSVLVSPPAVLPGQKAVITAGLRANGGKIDGQFVRFHAVPPEYSDLTVEEVFDQISAFDAEIVSYIPADGTHAAQVAFRPQEFGNHEILVSTLRNGKPILLGAANLQVVETLPTPTPTPIEDHGDNDDGCAIGTAADSSSKGVLLLLLFPLLFVAARPRRMRR